MTKRESIRKYFYVLFSEGPKGFWDKLFIFILKPFSFPYFLIIKAVQLLYSAGVLRKYRAGMKVVSVGNITMGGTAKTPFCEMLSDNFQKQGNCSAIVMRGYGAASGNGSQTDESIMLGEKVSSPVVINRDRKEAISYIKSKYNCDTVILDDGFQQWKLGKDADIVLINALNPFGNGSLIPAGLLREPVSSLVRADIVVLSNTVLCPQEELNALKEKIKPFVPDEKLFEVNYVPRSFKQLPGGELAAISQLKGKRVMIFCAIGNPLSFEKSLVVSGVDIVSKKFFTDHYWYSEDDLESIFRQCRENKIEAVITTHKDAARLRTFSDESFKMPLYILNSTLEFSGDCEERFYERINHLLSD